MFRVLTILAAVAALAVTAAPVGSAHLPPADDGAGPSLTRAAAHYIDDALGTGVRKLGTTGALAAPVAATDEPDAGAQVSLLYRDGVVVGEDGNGVRAARFATTVGGRDVRYVLVVENGCAGSNAVRPCPAPVRGLTVTLNDDVVFQNDEEFSEARREVALNPVEGDDNSLFIAANGAPGSGARVRILALRDPDKDKPKPKPEVLGLVYRDGVVVGEDGNGVRAARFATTVGGRDVRYVLVVENGCAGSNAVRPCPAPVRGLTVTLNDDVVFQNDEEFSEARREVALNPVEGDDNSLFIAANGAPGSGARVRILALRDPDKDKPKPKPEVLGLVYRDGVVVGEDGNGVRAARFATTVGGRDVRYVLVVENGCAGSNAVRPCPAPVRGLTVTLNDDVVFQNDEEFSEARREVALNPVEGDDNSLFIAANGAPGSGARVRILALRDPDKDKPKPKPEVLGLVYRDGVVVGEDGNGVRAARFATTVGGRDVRYVLVVENGCAGSNAVRPCPAPVRGLTVTLNDDVVFQNDEEFSEARREVALNPVEGDDNSLFIAAKGAPGSGARVRILALLGPLDQA